MITRNYKNVSAFARDAKIDPSTMSNLKKFGFISATTNKKIWDFLNKENEENEEKEVLTMCEESKDTLYINEEIIAPIDEEGKTLEQLEEELESIYEQTNELTTKVIQKREEEKRKKQLNDMAEELKNAIECFKSAGFSEENAQALVKEIILKSIDNM